MDSGGSPTAASPPRGFILNGKIMLSVIVTLFGIVISILFLHLYVRWHVRRRYDQRRRRNLLILTSSEHRTAGPTGLDEEVLNSIPVEIFDHDDGDAAECAVCLNGFDGGEKVRVLPRCGHRFHVDCIDMWFASHSTCPLCRSAVEAVTSSASEESDPVSPHLESEISDPNPRNLDIRIEIEEPSEPSGARASVK